MIMRKVRKCWFLAGNEYTIPSRTGVSRKNAVLDRFPVNAGAPQEENI